MEQAIHNFASRGRASVPRQLPVEVHARRPIAEKRVNWFRRFAITGLMFGVAASVVASNHNGSPRTNALAVTTQPSLSAPAAASHHEFLTLADEHFTTIRGNPGYWRLGQTVNDVWWFISPEDHLEWMNTVTTVQPFQLGRRTVGPNYLSRDWNGKTDLNSGDLRAWASTTLKRVRDSGFKGLGAWSNPVFHDFDIPMAQDLNIWSQTMPRLYDAQWATLAEQAIARQVAPLKDNRSLVGYYTDNELDWGDGGAGPGRYFDGLAKDDPNRVKVSAMIRTLWPALNDFNGAWNLKLAKWEDLDGLAALPHEPPDAYGKLQSAWIEQLATDYFRTTTELVKKYDPNHLMLGVRYKGHAPREVVRGSRDFTDAQSINYYVADARLDPDMFPMMHKESGGQPIILTEYSFHALDGRSGNRNTVGFVAQVMDQQARADGYRLLTTRLARTPYVVGGDWFQWNDEPPSGRNVDGEDVNFGVVDVDDRSYDLLTDAIREVSPKLNDLHFHSTSDMDLDVFRQRFSQRPTTNVPYLAQAPAINGELSDWPAQSKLAGMQRSQAVGLDRSPLPLPIVNLGWNERGVFVGITVFDRDIEGAPANGWWWTRDSVELFVSTRPPEPNQTFYTPHDAQFFFVPNSFPGSDGASGVVGRWHRPGDGLDASRIPDTSIVEASRVFPDRYVVEMFIPAEQLTGFDPTGKTPMSMNIYVRNFQNATDYFWSAPKEVQTQLRPDTWGELVLTKDNSNETASSGN